MAQAKREIKVAQKVGTLLVFLVLVILASAFGAQFGTGQWYEELVKPAWNPPAWVFAPVWSTLYLMMAVAAWLVWDTGHAQRKLVIAWWLAQLVLNALWSWLFFGLHRPGFALAELALLIIVLAVTIRLFHVVRPVAALLLLPYMAWLLFAWALNLTLWRLNGGGLATVLG